MSDYVLSATLELRDKLTGKLNNAAKSMESIKGSASGASTSIDKIGASATQSADKASRLKTALAGIRGNFSATAELKDNATAGITRVKSGVKSLNGMAARAVAGLRDEATPKLASIKSELSSIAGKTYDAVVNIKQNGNMQNDGGNKIKEGLSGFGSGFLMNTPMQMMGAAGMGFGVYDTIKTSMDFDAALSGVKALVPAGEDAGKVMDSVRKKAMELGQATAFGDTDVANGMTELLKAGISLDDVMKDATKAALDLAVVGDLQLPEAAKIMSTAMNAFGEKDATHAADILSGAANASATNVHEMSYAMAASAAVAHNLGVSFEDTNATLAVFAKNGLLGSDAGTSLKTMLSSMVPQTKKATEEMKKLGIITADGKNQFFDASGKMKSMSQVAEILKNSVKGLSSEEQQDAFYTMFGSDAIRGAVILASQGAKGIDEMTAAMKRFTAAHGAETKMDNLKGDLEQLSGSWENFQITLMQGSATGGLRSVVQELGRLVDFASNRLKDGLDFGDIFAVAGKGITDLKNKFLEFDGIGSILAGGVLAGGLLKIVKLSRRAFGGIRDVIGGIRGIGRSGAGAKSSVAAAAASAREMVVNAGSVVVNSKTIAGGVAGIGGTGSKAASKGVVYGPNGEIISTGTAGANRRGRFRPQFNKAAFAEFGAMSALFGGLDIYSQHQTNTERAEEADFGVAQARNELEAVKADQSASAEQIKDAAQNLAESQRYQAETERMNRVGMAESVGGTIGSFAGAALGSFLGPFGTVAGSILGEIAGSKIASVLANYNPMSELNLQAVENALKTPKYFDIDTSKPVPVFDMSKSASERTLEVENGSNFGIATDAAGMAQQSRYYSPPTQPEAPDAPPTMADMQLQSFDAQIQGMQSLRDAATGAAQESSDAWVQNNDIMQQSTADAATAMSATMSGAGSEISSSASDTGTQVSDAYVQANDTTVGVWGTIAGFFQGSVFSPTASGASTTGSSISTSFSNSAHETTSAWSGVSGFFAGLWAELKAGAASAAASMANSLASAASRLRAGGHGTIASAVDWVGNNMAYLGGTSYNQHAIGTSWAPGGWTEVNEHGGEIIDLPEGSRVYPHATTLKMLKSMFGDMAEPDMNASPSFVAMQMPENGVNLEAPAMKSSLDDNSFNPVLPSMPAINIDVPKAPAQNNQAPAVTITGNTFVVREEADIDRIAYQLAELFEMSYNNMNPVGGVAL